MAETGSLQTSTPIQFLQDEAADSDFFDGSHKRTAEAIKTLIATDQEIRIVGLLGEWGSGKSTVLNILQRRLVEDALPYSVYVFVYDAWLHQSDPPRRSFLECLTEFLIAQKLVD
jgi:predicted KAP-like P-loop ATPase